MISKNPMLHTLYQLKWVAAALALLMATALVALVLMLSPDESYAWLLDWLQVARTLPGTLAEIHPVLLVLAIAILPLVGVPVSFLFVAAGMAYGIGPACVYAMIGITLNNILGYQIAAHWFHGPVARLMQRRGWNIPELSRNDLFKVIVAFRLTPGFPLTVQNYLLGLAKVHFPTYLAASLLVQTLPVGGFVITGGSLFQGHWGLIFLGVCLLLAAALMARVISGRKRT